MKKLILSLALATVAMSGSAEKLYKSSRFFDNWSIGVNGGVQTNMHDWNVPQGGVAGLHIDKQVSPVFGLTFEGGVNFNGMTNWVHGTNHVHNHLHGMYNNTVDAAAGFVVGRVSLFNLFGGYQGQRRAFDIEALVGVGAGHTFSTVEQIEDEAFLTKAGLNFNFAVGEKRAWTINIKPAAVWASTAWGHDGNNNLDVRRAVTELTAGVTYHFKNSNGTHSFAFGRGYDQAEVDALNGNINDLRGSLNAKEAELSNAHKTIKDLEKALNDCRNQKPVVKTVTETKTITKTNNLPDVLVTFGQGKRVVDASQLPNVERVASYLKSHKSAKVVIKGYASPEGNPEVNARIANERAQAVSQILVKKYGISSSRISAEGQGVGDMFSEPDWNRVSICTITED